MIDECSKLLSLAWKNPSREDEKPAKTQARKKTDGYEPPNLGKAICLPVPDFSHPDRPPVCAVPFIELPPL